MFNAMYIFPIFSSCILIKSQINEQKKNLVGCHGCQINKTFIIIINYSDIY